MTNKRLKMYRMLKGVKQEEMAEILNVSLTTYSNKETGKTGFTLAEAKTMSDFFNTSIDSLFFNNGDNEMNIM